MPSGPPRHSRRFATSATPAWLVSSRRLAFCIRQRVRYVSGGSSTSCANRAANAARRWLLPLDPEYAAESLAISRDGSHVTVAYVDQLFSLMVAENVPGVERPRRAAGE